MNGNEQPELDDEELNNQIDDLKKKKMSDS